METAAAPALTPVAEGEGLETSGETVARATVEAAVEPREVTLESLLEDATSVAGFDAALAALFGRWELDYAALAGITPCAKADYGGLSCLQGKGTLTGLKGLNRPALITLAGAGGRQVFAVVAATSGDTVTVEAKGHRLEVEAARLEALWSGDYLILWKPPPGYRGMLRLGMRGRDVAWLRNRLAGVNGDSDGSSDRFDRGLKDRVIAFQRSRKISVDGIAGPQTLIRLNTAARDPAVPYLRPPEP